MDDQMRWELTKCSCGCGAFIACCHTNGEDLYLVRYASHYELTPDKQDADGFDGEDLANRAIREYMIQLVVDATYCNIASGSVPVNSDKSNTSSSITILDEAKEICNGSRQADYGDSNENLKCIAEIATAIGQPIDPIGVCRVMVAVKLARQKYKHKRDNLVDLAGYIELWSRLYK